MEMESFALLDLARSSKGTIKATATAIVVANRPTGKVPPLHDTDTRTCCLSCRISACTSVIICRVSTPTARA